MNKYIEEDLTASTSTWRPPTVDEEMEELMYQAMMLSVATFLKRGKHIRKIKAIGSRLRLLTNTTNKEE